MRKAIMLLAGVAILAAFSAPANARPLSLDHNDYVAPAVGAGTGLAVGIGASQGVLGGTALAGLGATAAASAVAGGVAGVGAVAVVDSVLQPCKGFHALFGINHMRGIVCRDGHAVGRY